MSHEEAEQITEAARQVAKVSFSTMLWVKDSLYPFNRWRKRVGVV